MARTKRPASTPHRAPLIQSIEIAYFRGFYKVDFKDLRGLNIFFGENDVGKSNVMRALNLFFNGTVGDGNEFDFDIDLSADRLKEAKAASDVRKFVYVKVWFRTPAVHRKALGDVFYVKRTWSQATGSEYHQETSKHIKTSGQQQSLTKFLNKIIFTYVPAVKDRSVYSDLLEDSYIAISQISSFSLALDAFTQEIRNQTAKLSKKLNTSLGMDSVLSPPTDLAELFSSLDFETLVAGGQQMSLLRQRGDGIQARHIPELMAFIAEVDAKPFRLWGIEEPENSLSINSSLALADRLKYLPREAGVQIFLTTHSPSFYCLSGDVTKKYFLSKKDSNRIEVLDGTSADSAKLMEFMGDKFYLPIVAESVREIAVRNAELTKSLDSLQKQIKSANRPLFFVEGDTD